MKILNILGSPKKKGNTATVLDLFETIISKDHEVERINIADHNIKGCQGCMTCQATPDAPGCILDDSVLSILQHIISSDVIVYATPLYCWSFTSQMKALMDRHFCLATGLGTPQYQSLISGKRTALLVSCGGPVENNADLIPIIFDRLNDYLQTNVMGKYIVPFCTTPDEIPPEAKETVQKMAKEILSS